MRILFVSDVEEGWLYEHYDAERMKGVDLVVSCGDLPAWYLEGIVSLSNVPLAYVRGNHDVAYESAPPLGCVDIDGCLRDFRGLRILGLGGSLRYDDRVYGFSESEMRRRVGIMVLLAQASGGADVVVTHAPVRGYGDKDDFPHRGFKCFDLLLDRLRPRYFVHGHVHREYGSFQRTMEHPYGTTIVNACGSYLLDIPDQEIRVREGISLRPPAL